MPPYTRVFQSPGLKATYAASLGIPTATQPEDACKRRTWGRRPVRVPERITSCGSCRLAPLAPTGGRSSPGYVPILLGRDLANPFVSAHSHCFCTVEFPQCCVRRPVYLGQRLSADALPPHILSMNLQLQPLVRQRRRPDPAVRVRV